MASKIEEAESISMERVTKEEEQQAYRALQKEAVSIIQFYQSRRSDLLRSSRSYASLQDIEEHLEEGRFEIELSGYHFYALYQPRPGKHLYVTLSAGGREDTEVHYVRWSYYAFQDGSILSIEDPMYQKHPGLHTAWFYGTKDHCLMQDTIALIRSVCRHLGFRDKDVIFYCNSSGGTAALYGASVLSECLCIVINPQIDLAHNKWTAEVSKAVGVDFEEPDIFSRNKLPQLVKASNSKFVVLYNVDSYEDAGQHTPFLARYLGLMPLQYGLKWNEHVLFWGYNAMGDHGAEDQRELAPYILHIARKFAAGMLSEADTQKVLFFNQLWYRLFEEISMNAHLKERLDQEQAAHEMGAMEQTMWVRVLRLAVETAPFLKEHTVDAASWVGMPFRYALIRALEACHPQRLLEFGFDDATKMAAQYAVAAGGHHDVYDWDYQRVSQALASWGRKLYHTEIHGSEPLPVYRGKHHAIIYPAFEQEVQVHPEKRYDFILVKRTRMRDGNMVPSMDIMPYLPGILAESFVILLDCADTSCESMMLLDVENMLRSHDISFQTFPLSDGTPEAALIVSENWAETVREVL